ncbi:MAG: A/G-specific adenine glycosylase [Actinomycetota bacterium]|nr:A/G-specific adenine glycosylase [Actinomycetota bacterium]
MHELVPAATVLTALPELHRRVNGWYAVNARPLPWRRPDTTAWGVFLSEVMSHQTPVARVEPVWASWLGRWPTPGDLAAEPAGEAVRAWGRLGYPRRALRLHEAARAMVERHDGQVPGTVEELLALPGVGTYTAAAVACFAFGVSATVLDTNVRRVLARTLLGQEYAAPALTRAEARLADQAMPPDPGAAGVWNVAAMELGALVCTARAPRCGDCPVADLCAWRRGGYPAHDGPARRGQSWHGTDRQARGRLLAVLREAPGEVDAHLLQAAWPDERQRMRCLDSLVADGLVEPLAGDRYRLPA